jgi:adenosylcobinamide-phosphate synthase
VGAELVACTALALALDCWLGDPRWLPHPVRGMGRACLWLEPRLVRALGRTRLAGVVLVIAIVGGSAAVAWAALALAAQLSMLLHAALATLLLYTAFAARDLDVEARGISAALGAADLPGARRALSRIVGRDTEQLSEPEVIRGAVESVAESTLDGCLSPLFWALVGGPPAALAFKAASTLDSMVGHRDERYLRFGWAAARLDDVLGWLPARVARAFFPLGAALCGLRPLGAWRIAWRDGRRSPSPNAGIPEAAAAGALGIQLGGRNTYHGEVQVRPALGDALRPLEIADIRRAVQLMYATTGVAFVCLTGARLAALRILA